MADIKKNWSSQVWIEGDAVPTWTTLSSTTEEFSATVNMETDGYEAAHVKAEVDFQGSPNGNIEIAFYGSLDGSDWDSVPFHKITMDKDAGDNDLSFVIAGYSYWRMGFVNTNGADTANKVRASYKGWNYVST